jgi:hypothetical protein
MESPPTRSLLSAGAWLQPPPFLASEGTAGSPSRGLGDRFSFVDRGSECNRVYNNDPKSRPRINQTQQAVSLYHGITARS